MKNKTLNLSSTRKGALVLRREMVIKKGVLEITLIEGTPAYILIGDAEELFDLKLNSSLKEKAKFCIWERVLVKGYLDISKNNLTVVSITPLRWMDSKDVEVEESDYFENNLSYVGREIYQNKEFKEAV